VMATPCSKFNIVGFFRFRRSHPDVDAPCPSVGPLFFSSTIARMLFFFFFFFFFSIISPRPPVNTLIAEDFCPNAPTYDVYPSALHLFHPIGSLLNFSNFLDALLMRFFFVERLWISPFDPSFLTYHYTCLILLRTPGLGFLFPPDFYFLLSANLFLLRISRPPRLP